MNADLSLPPYSPKARILPDPEALELGKQLGGIVFCSRCGGGVEIVRPEVRASGSLPPANIIPLPPSVVPHP